MNRILSYSFLIASLILSAEPASTCFYPDGTTTEPNHKPCNTTISNSACCDPLDSCTTSGICLGRSGFNYRGKIQTYPWPFFKLHGSRNYQDHVQTTRGQIQHVQLAVVPVNATPSQRRRLLTPTLQTRSTNSPTQPLPPSGDVTSPEVVHSHTAAIPPPEIAAQSQPSSTDNPVSRSRLATTSYYKKYQAPIHRTQRL